MSTKLNKGQRRFYHGNTPGTLSGAGTIDLNSNTTYFTSTGSNALVLPDGLFDGQRVTITHVVDGGSGTFSYATSSLNTDVLGAAGTVVLSELWESVTFEWSKANAWWTPIINAPITVCVYAS